MQEKKGHALCVKLSICALGIECDDKKFSNRTEHTTDNDLKCFFMRGTIINPGSGKMVDAIRFEKTEAIFFIYCKNCFLVLKVL